MSTLPKIIVILGPTATGKTKLAVKLARRFNGEIVSADSRQVYRGLDIGTGKDLSEYTLTQKARKHKNTTSTTIPHHLINILNPDEEFNVALFKELAIKKISEITKRGRLPIVVGGTGLYISALIDNYDIPPVKPNQKNRQKILKMTKADKIKLLQELDAAALNFVAIDNPRRLDRALEVCLTGHIFSRIRKIGQPLFNALQLGLTLPKDVLKKRIEKRVGKMMAQGLAAETKKLLKKYRHRTAPLQTIGYQEVIDYLIKVETRRGASLQNTINLIKLHTYQLTKRQMTWFKRDRRIIWVSSSSQAQTIIKNFLSKR